MIKPPTNRQQEVIVLWSQGYTAREVGQILGINSHCVYHRMYRYRDRDWNSYQRMMGIRRAHIRERIAFHNPLQVTSMVTWSMEARQSIVGRDGEHDLKIFRRF